MAKKYTPDQIKKIEDKVEACKNNFKKEFQNLDSLLKEIECAENDSKNLKDAYNKIFNNSGPIFEALLKISENNPDPKSTKMIKDQNTARYKKMLR
jgi:hypothetical protein